MNLDAALSALGLGSPDPLTHELLAAVAAATPSLPTDWQVLATAVARDLAPPAPPWAVRAWRAWDTGPAPLVLGVAGAQGSGKSTLARALAVALAAAGARVVACSLDDFYLSRARRRELARSVHPLLATRGVPGTHDLALLRHFVGALGERGSTRCPVFDKASDDPRPESRWPVIDTPVDVLVLEGWCLGARAQSADDLAKPVNALEAEEDSDGHWRGYVNAALARDYQPLWERFEALAYLQVPDMAAVARWRGEQEQSLPAKRRMSAAALTRFIAHYQRLTLAMAADLPIRADLLVTLDETHRVAGMRRNTGV